MVEIINYISEFEYTPVKLLKEKLDGLDERTIRLYKEQHNNDFFIGDTEYIILSNRNGYIKVHINDVNNSEHRPEIEKTMFRYISQGITMLLTGKKIATIINHDINQVSFNELAESQLEELSCK